MGAIASGGVRVLNDDVSSAEHPAEVIEAVDAKERRELERRERAYRGDRPPPDLAGTTVILVDDGLATGSTHAGGASRRCAPTQPARDRGRGAGRRPRAICEALREVVDEVVCARRRGRSAPVGVWYGDFSPDHRRRGPRRCCERARRPTEPRRAPDGGARPAAASASPTTTTSLERVDAARASCCSARRPTARTSSTASARSMTPADRRKGFSAVAVEADWPDAYRVNRYVRGAQRRRDGRGGALRTSSASRPGCGATRTCWSSSRWLREHNDVLGDASGQGRVLRARPLQPVPVDRGGHRRTSNASTRDAARAPASATPASTSSAATPGLRLRGRRSPVPEPCEQEVVEQLVELQDRAAEIAGRDGRIAADEQFFAEQNARLVIDAEEYYRACSAGGRR